MEQLHTRDVLLEFLSADEAEPIPLSLLSRLRGKVKLMCQICHIPLPDAFLKLQIEKTKALNRLLDN